MAKITINVSSETLTLLEELAQLCTETNQERDGATSHGDLTVLGLLEMLAEDAAMVISRPGSWEGANMRAVLTGHGYE